MYPGENRSSPSISGRSGDAAGTLGERRRELAKRTRSYPVRVSDASQRVDGLREPRLPGVMVCPVEHEQRAGPGAPGELRS